MGEEKVNSVDEKENLGKNILKIGGLLLITFMLLVFGLAIAFQGNFLGAWLVALSIVFTVLSCKAEIKGGVSECLKNIVWYDIIFFGLLVLFTFAMCLALEQM